MRTRKSRRPRLGLITVVACAMLTFSSSLGWAGDFQVTTTVTSPKAEVLARKTSLFHGSRVYCFETDEPLAAEVLIVDIGQRTATLYNPQRKVKSVITFDAMEQFAEAVAAKVATGDPPPLIRFAAAPEFERVWNADHNRLQLQSTLLSYGTDLATPREMTAVELYATFADAAAQLNTLDGGMPAHARMHLNRQIAQASKVPTRVTRDTQAGQLTSNHKYAWQLTPDDLELATELDRRVDQANRVGFTDYRDQRRR